MGNKYLNIGDMEMDYVDGNGNLVKNDAAKMVMIRNKSDLDLLDDGDYRPGTFAYTAGFKNLYQLDANYEWQTIVEEVVDGG